MTLARRGLLGLTLALMLPLAAAAQPAAVTADDRVMGRADAPATIIAYVSPTCGHCGDWATTELPTLRARYVDTGRARIVFREIMTAPPNLAMAATAIARCAPAASYFAVMDRLFAGQDALFRTGEASPWLLGAARAGGMDEAAVQRCLQDDAALDRLQARQEQAASDGVSSTPTFFINGQRMQDHALSDFEAEMNRLAPPGR